MPIYEYKCGKCEEKFELRRSFSDDDKDVKCPVCGAEETERLLSMFATSGVSSSGDSCSTGST